MASLDAQSASSPPSPAVSSSTGVPGGVAPRGGAGAGGPSRAPIIVRLALGLTLSLLTIIGFSLYATHEIGRLGDEQMALSDRNRRDSLQLIRIQNNLSTLAITLRDMMERAEPYPMAAWAHTFERLRFDLTQALALERTLAPARPPVQQQQVAETAARFWTALDAALVLAARGDEQAAVDAVRSAVLPRHAELVDLVAQLLVRNTQVEDDAAAAARDVYTRVAHQIYWLMGMLVAAVAVAGLLNIAATRRAFDEVRTLSGQLRALTWRMLRLQEDVQTSTARELHDEFGQILTAMTMMLGRVHRKVHAEPVSLDARGAGAAPSLPPADDEPRRALIRDLEEVQGIARDTLDRIRTQSRLLHPVILDDFGLEQALIWYVDQFSRQHGIHTTITCTDVGTVPPEAAIHLYRIVQEALSNVSRHSGATEAEVRLARESDPPRGARIRVEIEDRGHGLLEWRGVDSQHASRPGPRTRDAIPTGIGMTSMRERAELMGGQFTLIRSASGGLIVRCTVPVHAP